METVGNYWKSFVEFLTEYKVDKVSDVIRGLDWQEVIRNPIFWVVSLALLGLILWKQQFKLLIVMASFVAFVFLTQLTLPPGGQAIPLTSLLEFVGGTMTLLAINVYFLIIKN
ncbi:MAG: hypothetical protein AB9873_02965 [Syntrophobacteraceae bacterium]